MILQKLGYNDKRGNRKTSGSYAVDDCNIKTLF